MRKHVCQHVSSCFWCINVHFLYLTSMQTWNSLDPNKYLATWSPHIFGCYFRGLFPLILVYLSSCINTWQCFFARFSLLVLPLGLWCQYLPFFVGNVGNVHSKEETSMWPWTIFISMSLCCLNLAYCIKLYILNSLSKQH